MRSRGYGTRCRPGNGGRGPPRRDRPRSTRQRQAGAASALSSADDAAQEGQGRTGEPEQAERALALAQPGDDVHGETAGGDDEARHDDHVGHVLDHRQNAGGRGLSGFDCDRMFPGREDAVRGRPGPFDRILTMPSVATTIASTGRRAALGDRHVRDGQTVDDALRVVPEDGERK